MYQQKVKKSLLFKALNFAIPPDKLEYSDFLLLSELLFCDIQNLDVTDQKKLLKLELKIVHFYHLICVIKTVLL